MQYPLDLGNEASHDRQPGYINFHTVANKMAYRSNIQDPSAPSRSTLYDIESLPSVRMYIPSGIQYNDSVSYGQRDLGLAGAIGAQGSVSGTEGLEAALKTFFGGELNRDGAQFALNNLAANLLGPLTGGLFGGLTGGILGTLVDPSKMEAGMSYAAQRAINPHTKALLERVSLRTFTFQFTMIPVSKTEADMITKIVKHFRTELYPETQALIEGESNPFPAFYRYPNKFDISIHPGGPMTEESKVIKFKTSVLQNVSITHNSTAVSYFEDGSPVETMMTLTFTEDSTMSKEDVIRGGY